MTTQVKPIPADLVTVTTNLRAVRVVYITCDYCDGNGMSRNGMPKPCWFCAYFGTWIHGTKRAEAVLLHLDRLQGMDVK